MERPNNVGKHTITILLMLVVEYQLPGEQEGAENSCELLHPSAGNSGGEYLFSQQDFELSIVSPELTKIVSAIGLLIFLSTSTQVMSAPFLWINPVSSEVKIGETVTIQLMAHDVNNLYGIELEIGFDAAVIEAVDTNAGSTGVQILPGDCPLPDFEISNLADNSSGTIIYAATSFSPSAPCSGGTVASITFKGLAEGQSNLFFSQSVLSDPNGQTILHSNQNGEIKAIKGADVDDDLLLFIPAIIGGKH